MRLCSNKLNLTIGVTSMTASDLLIVERHYIRGALGEIISKYLDLDKRNLCQFIATSGTGTKLANGSWTGSMKLLKEKAIDIDIRPQALLLANEDFMQRSTRVVRSEGFHIGQFFDHHPKRERNDVLTIFDLNLDLKLIFILQLISIYFVVFLMILKMNIRSKIKSMIINLTHLPIYLLSRRNFIGLVFLLFSGSFAFIKSILTNNINSSTVIVDTQNLIQTKNDLLLHSQSKLCWLLDEIEYHIVKTSPANHFLTKLLPKSTIYDLKTQSNKLCFYGKNSQGALKMIKHKRALFLRILNLWATLSGLSNLMDENYHIWINLQSFFELNYYHLDKPIAYLDNKTPETQRLIDYYKKMIVFFPTQELESGINQNFCQKLYSRMHFDFIYKVPTFFKISDYVNAFSKFSSIGIDFFGPLFFAFIAINSLILITFLIAILIVKLRKFVEILKCAYLIYHRLGTTIFDEQTI